MEERDYQKNTESKEPVGNTPENSSLESDFSKESETKKTGTKKKIIIGSIVGVIAVVCIAGLALGVGSPTNESADSIKEEQEIQPPEITLYNESFFVAVNQEISLQDDIIQSISGEQIENVTLTINDAEKKDILTVNDLTGEQEKNGVPAKSLSFSEEGDFSVDITAIDINGNETTVTVDFEVGNELLSYVEGIHKWTIEQNAEDIDFLKDITWNKDYVESVTVDASKVDLAKIGKYTLTYKITATEKLNLITEEVEVDVEVIDKTTAQKEADNGIQVTTSGGEVKKTSSGKTPTGNITSSNSSGKNNNSSSSSGSNGSSGSGNSSSSGGNSGSSGGSGSVETHKHSYTIPITETIHHDAVTHTEDQGRYETVTISEAWDEPIYETHWICGGCGADLTVSGESQVSHVKNHALNDGYTCNVRQQQVQVGSNHHDAVTEQQWVPNIVTVIDKEAWDEVKTIGYKCECGAEQK